MRYRRILFFVARLLKRDIILTQIITSALTIIASLIIFYFSNRVSRENENQKYLQEKRNEAISKISRVKFGYLNSINEYNIHRIAEHLWVELDRVNNYNGVNNYKDREKAEGLIQLEKIEKYKGELDEAISNLEIFFKIDSTLGVSLNKMSDFKPISLKQYDCMDAVCVKKKIDDEYVNNQRYVSDSLNFFYLKSIYLLAEQIRDMNSSK